MEFKLDFDADVGGTAKIGDIEVCPADLVRLFGQPDGPSGDGKVSGEYRFVTPEGLVVTLYDYKETTAYYGTGDPDIPTPEELWALEAPFAFSVGGTLRCHECGENDALFQAFKDWLLPKVNADRKTYGVEVIKIEWHEVIADDADHAEKLVRGGHGSIVKEVTKIGEIREKKEERWT